MCTSILSTRTNSRRDVESSKVSSIKLGWFAAAAGFPCFLFLQHHQTKKEMTKNPKRQHSNKHIQLIHSEDHVSINSFTSITINFNSK